MAEQPKPINPAVGAAARDAAVPAQGFHVRPATEVFLETLSPASASDLGKIWDGVACAPHGGAHSQEWQIEEAKGQQALNKDIFMGLVGHRDPAGQESLSKAAATADAENAKAGQPTAISQNLHQIFDHLKPRAELTEADKQQQQAGFSGLINTLEQSARLITMTHDMTSAENTVCLAGPAASRGPLGR